MTLSDGSSRWPEPSNSWEAGVARDLVRLLLVPDEGYENARTYLEQYQRFVASDAPWAVKLLEYFQDESHHVLLEAYVYYRTWSWPPRHPRY